MHNRDLFFNSLDYLMYRLREDYEIFIQSWQLQDIMRNHMLMKYKKVKVISFQANSPKNLILRRQFAETFLMLDLYGKRIINVDETWVGETDFRRRRWTFTHQSDSVPKKQVQPRISLIAALDTKGRVYQAAS